MSKTAKFTVSMTMAEFRELESLKKRTGLTRSRVVRDALRKLGSVSDQGSSVGDPRVDYGRDRLPSLIDLAERRRRAIAAAGRFRSEAADLSERHDEYFAEAVAGAGPDEAE